jgi:adenylate kinase
MDAGKLVSDDVMIGIVKERLGRPDAVRGIVLDGFPRTVAQAHALDDMLDDDSPLIVIDVEVPEDVLALRLDARRICKVCGWTAPPGPHVCERCGGELVQRKDDGADVVRERLRVYAQESRPLVEFYRYRPTFRSVDGDQVPEAVAADISAAVASVLGDQP